MLFKNVFFWKTSTETLSSRNPKNPKNNPKTWYVKEEKFNKYDIIYIVENVLESSIQ